MIGRGADVGGAMTKLLRRPGLFSVTSQGTVADAVRKPIAPRSRFFRARTTLRHDDGATRHPRTLRATTACASAARGRSQ